MTDIIEFPNQGENFFNEAIKALQEQDLATGLKLLRKSYQSDQNENALVELANLYIFLNDLNALDQLWIDGSQHLNPIVNEDVLELYIRSLIVLDTPQEALFKLYRLQNEKPPLENGAEIISFYIDDLESQIKIQEELENIESEEDIQNYLLAFKEKKPSEQLEQLKTLYPLDIYLTIEIFTDILADHDILNIVKSDILNFLITYQIPHPLPLAWFDEMVEVNTNSLKPMHEMKRFKEVEALIEDYTDKHNPHLYQDLIEQFLLQSLVLYPFIDEAITDPEAWFQLSLANNGLIEKPQVEVEIDLMNRFSQVFQQIEKF